MIGLSYSEILEITPYELTLFVEAYKEKQKTEFEEKITLSYLTAMWAAQWFSEEQPERLDKIIEKIRAASVEEGEDNEEEAQRRLIEQLRFLNSALGGKELYRNGNEKSID